MMVPVLSDRETPPRFGFEIWNGKVSSNSSSSEFNLQVASFATTQAKEPLAKLVVDESLKNKLSKTLGVLISAYLAILEIPSFARGSKA